MSDNEREIEKQKQITELNSVEQNLKKLKNRRIFKSKKKVDEINNKITEYKKQKEVIENELKCINYKDNEIQLYNLKKEKEKIMLDVNKINNEIKTKENEINNEEKQLVERKSKIIETLKESNVKIVEGNISNNKNILINNKGKNQITERGI